MISRNFEFYNENFGYEISLPEYFCFRNEKKKYLIFRQNIVLIFGKTVKNLKRETSDISV